MVLLPFDAHNHIQLGPPPPSPWSPSPKLPQLPPTLSSEMEMDRLTKSRSANTNKNKNKIIVDVDVREEKSDNGTSHHPSFLVRSLGEYIKQELQGKHLSGMAMMATHPRDFSTVIDLERELHTKSRSGVNDNSETTLEEMTIVSCLGVHPWFLHELDPKEDWALVPSSSPLQTKTRTKIPTQPESIMVPHWIANLESLLADHSHRSVGEIGLDGFHFDPITQELTTPMDRQIEAFKLQLELATRLHRPVSLHCVRAMGKLLDALNDIAEVNYQRLSAEWNSDEFAVTVATQNAGEAADREDIDLDDEHFRNRNHRILPPRLYFHAFGGKAATATQLLKTLEKPRRIKIRNDSLRRHIRKKFITVVPPKVYFGFAPPVNFRSPKTASVIQAVGLERLVLETDREDVQKIGPDMEAGTTWISEVLGITKDELVLATNENARDLYGWGK